MRFIIIVAACTLIYGFFRYMEKRSTFFPMKRIEYTPQYIHLTYEDISFQTADGLTLNGWFIPAEREGPVALFCHGNAGNISHRLEVIEMLHAAGLSVFIFDYRGYGKSEGSPSERGTYYDAMAAYDYLRSKKNSDIRKTIIYGESLGGAVAIDLASRRNAGALIIEGTFTSVPDMASEIYPFLPLKFFMTIHYDSLSKIKSVSIPKLMIHSRDDEIIPFEQGRRLFKAAAEPKSFFEMRGGHNYAVILEKEAFKKELERFLREYNVFPGR